MFNKKGKGGGYGWLILILVVGGIGFLVGKGMLFSAIPLYNQISNDTHLQLLLYGNDLVDYSMYHHALTGTPDYVTQGFFGTGYSFVRADSYINTSITLANNSDMCFMAWVNKQGTSAGNYGRFFSADNAERVLYSDAYGQNYFQFAYGSTLLCNGAVRTTNLIGVWHHIAAVKSGTNILLYVDGVQEASCTTSELRQIKNIIIGNSNTLTRSVNASMDEIRIYDRACTVQEIKDAANSSNYVVQNQTPTCTDGIQNQGETGVDCGGPCSACVVAPTCTDGIQNQGETGVDCGGAHCAACPVIPTCTDSVKNQDETGIDCGGAHCSACPVVPSCVDSIQNQGETGVDCGGPCAACVAVPTCSDGVKNQNEVGIDCGGVCTTVCPTCSDGIKNQNEVGVDCGGACANCQTNQTTCTLNEDCLSGEVCNAGKCETNIFTQIMNFVNTNLLWVGIGVIVLIGLIIVMKK